MCQKQSFPSKECIGKTPYKLNIIGDCRGKSYETSRINPKRLPSFQLLFDNCSPCMDEGMAITGKAL